MEKCKRCGLCCGSKNGIGWVSINKLDIIKWKESGILNRILPFLNTTDALSKSGYIIDFDEHNRQCPFLINAAGFYTCSIHSEHGYKFKPIECRNFNPEEWDFCPRK